MIRAVCFDLDGLMFNTEHVFYDAGDILLQRRGLRMTPAAMNSMLGRRPLESFQGLIDHLGLTETPAELLAESRTIFEAMLPERLQPMPGLFELLQRIEERGLPKGVATSSPRDYLYNVLDRFELRPRFSITLTAADVTHGKPHPEIYLKAAELLQVQPHEMLVLEDSHAGTKAAVAAGCHIISVPHEHTAGHDFAGTRHIATGLIDPEILRLVSGGALTS